MIMGTYSIDMAYHNNVKPIERIRIPDGVSRFQRKLLRFQFLQELEKHKISRELYIEVPKEPPTFKDFKIESPYDRHVILHIRVTNPETLKQPASRIRPKLKSFILRMYRLKMETLYEEHDELKFKYRIFVMGEAKLLNYLKGVDKRRRTYKCYCKKCKVCKRRMRVRFNHNAWIERLEQTFYTQEQLRNLENSEKEILINA